MADFIHELEIELKPRVNEILSHVFLRRLSAGDLSRDQLKEFSLQYFFYCGCFPRCVAFVAAATPDDETRLPLVKNLWEEHGCGTLSQSHRVLFQDFMRGIGVEPEQWERAKPLPSTAKYVASIERLCRDEPFLVGLGAIGPGTEFFTSDEYALVLSGLGKNADISGAALEFWKVHVEEDDGHYGAIAEALRRWTTSKLNRDQVRKGASSAIDLEIEFWNGLARSI